ncbi:hypothetical protein EZV62_000812 [Acer yangbiense]|uniref:Uncharacterized protein n=1 Tax=Acer yangbiense TaxID=1000413 RepID=A0A5C7GPG8_9ROSI|nr:hypothetical protein EZV62_028074 [Acer yangbiense]TXG72233.1 hypothetical protein EZV62_000812 [Acer yangbiense]
MLRLCLLVVSLVMYVSTIQLSAAFRPLHDSNQLLKKYFPNNYLQSLQKGPPVPPSASSPCTFIPSPPGGQCRSLNGKNFAGHVNRAPPPPKPDTVVDFSVAVSTK